MKVIYPSVNLDEALAKHRRPGDIIELRDLTYESAGSGVFEGGIGLAPGVTLDASRARIRLVNPVRTDRPWLDFPWLGDGSSVIGGEWDLGEPGGLAMSGFHAVGSCRISDVHLRGLFGRRVATGEHIQKEVFGFWQTPGSGKTSIERMQITGAEVGPDNYASGIYLNDRHAEARECHVALAGFGQFAYSCALPARFVECDGEALRFVYTDWSDCHALLHRCNGIAEWAAIALVGSSKFPGAARHVTAVDCQLICPEGRLVEFDDTDEPQDASVVIHGGHAKARYRIATNSARSRAIFLGDVEYVKDYIAEGSRLPTVP